MSEKNDLLMTLINILLKSKGLPEGIGIQDILPAAAPTGAPPAGGNFGLTPMQGAGGNEPGPDARSMQGEMIPKAPLQPFSWEAEEKVAYVPGKYGPIREEKAAVPPTEGWPAYRRFGKQFSHPRYGGTVSEKRYSYPRYWRQGAGTEKQFSVPQYGWRGGENGQRYSRMGSCPFARGEEHPAGDEPAGDQPSSRVMGQGFGVPYRRSPYALQPWPWRR